MDYQNLLNEEQLKPVMDTEGAVQVFAGAGSGKTRVLTYRIAYLIEVMKTSPYQILAITFTNKAAKQMQERVRQVTGQSGVWVSTFHSLCARVLRADISVLGGYNDKFTIYSEQDSANVVARILKAMNVDAKEKKSYLGYISKAKNLGWSPEKFYANVKFRNSDLVYEVFKKYEEELKDSNALDFDDLMIKTVQVFTENKEVLSKWQDRFRYIHVDEFQDTNTIQLLLVRMLANKYGNIFVVGDDDQSIYSWRGAVVRNMIDFTKYFAGCRVYKLERNYRSTSNILDVANKIIAVNTERVDKVLWTDCGIGAKVIYQHLYDDKSEADYVLVEIKNLIRSNDYKPSDFAILVRANSLTRNFEEKMNLYGIAYKVYGGFKFYERKEILDVIAYLRLISNERDNEAMLRIINFPRRGIGDTTVEKLVNIATISNCSLLEALDNIESSTVFNNSTKIKLSEFRDLIKELRQDSAELKIDELLKTVTSKAGIISSYKKDVIEDMNRIENIEEFQGSIMEYVRANPGAMLDDYLQSVALISASDDDSGECVTIATIHAVKGLEYKVCFVVGCEDNIIPSRNAIEEGSIDEERRCMYVAVTRARERLYLTSAGSRFRFGKYENNKVSSFVNDAGLVKKVIDNTISSPNKLFGELSNLLKSKNIDVSASSDSNRIQAKARTGMDMTGFEVGAKVIHKKYGEGTISAIDGVNAVIEFPKLGVREFNLQLAPIKLVE